MTEMISSSCTWGDGPDVLLTIESLSDVGETQHFDLSSGQAKSVGYGLILNAKRAEALEDNYQKDKK